MYCTYIIAARGACERARDTIRKGAQGGASYLFGVGELYVHVSVRREQNALVLLPPLQLHENRFSQQRAQERPAHAKEEN